MRTIKTLHLVPLMLIALIAGVAIAVTFFSQNVTQVSVNASIVANCASLVASPSSVTNGTATAVTFNCGAKSAFSVKTGGSYLPTFTLPSQYSSFAINNGTSFALTNNVRINLAVGNYSYVGQTVALQSGSTIPGFSITWGN